MAEDRTNEIESSQAMTPSKKRSKGLIALVLLGIVLIVAAVLFFVKQESAGSAATEAQVSITSDGFLPATIRVHEGDTVTWVNGLTDKESQIASDPYSSNDSFSELNQDDSMMEGDTYSFTFENAGVYSYHDNKNPEYTGQVIVIKE